MTLIRFRLTDGKVREINARNGLTVMEAALLNQVEGIDAICGGAGACGTCHVYIDSRWSSLVGGPDSIEAAMFESLPSLHPTSRLSCQITVTQAMEGLEVELPESQGSS